MKKNIFFLKHNSVSLNGTVLPPAQSHVISFFHSLPTLKTKLKSSSLRGHGTEGQNTPKFHAGRSHHCDMPAVIAYLHSAVFTFFFSFSISPKIQNSSRKYVLHVTTHRAGCRRNVKGQREVGGRVGKERRQDLLMLFRADEMKSQRKRSPTLIMHWTGLSFECVYSRLSAVVLLTTGWYWCLGTSSLTWGRIMTCGSWRASPRTDSPARPEERAARSPRRAPSAESVPPANPPSIHHSCTTYPVRRSLSLSLFAERREKKTPSRWNGYEMSGKTYALVVAWKGDHNCHCFNTLFDWVKRYKEVWSLEFR